MKALICTGASEAVPVLMIGNYVIVDGSVTACDKIKPGEKP